MNKLLRSIKRWVRYDVIYAPIGSHKINPDFAVSAVI